MRMKTLLPILVLFSSAILAAQAQVGQTAAAAPDVLTSAATTPSSGAVKPAPEVGAAYSVVARGADYRLWQRVEWEPTRSGRSIPHTHSYTEISTSMHYLQDGHWLETKEEIEIVEKGALATKGPHKVSFAANINSPVSVEVRTPDNKRLKIRPLGLAYYDFHTGTNILIAELKDSEGLLLGTNQVIYPDAFTDFRADVRYTYKKSGLEQDVILRQRPPSPEAYGLNPATTWLWVLTEFIDPPADVQVAREVRRGWTKSTVDKIITLGTMSIGHGTAFGLGLGQDRNAGVPVQKHWTVMDGRTFLIEEVTFGRIVPQLRNLQASTQPAPGGGASSTRHLASKSLVLPPVRVASATTPKAMQIASVLPKEEGLVLDFDLQSGTGLVLQGDTTYHVTGTVNLTNAVIEGGAVVKYNRGTRINLVGPVQCLTGPYRPAVFTAVDDNSVGESLGTGSPTGRYADCALALGLGGDLKYLNIRYAKSAIYCGNHDYSVSHSQLLFCDVGFHSETANFTNCNILTFEVLTNFYGSHFHGLAEHLTADRASVVMDDWNFDYDALCQGNPSSTLTLVNSLTASLTNGYAFYPINQAIARNYVSDSPSGMGVFQAVGAGVHYLVDGSTNRNAGTTNIQPSLASALKHLTTCPPILYSNATLSAATTFSPQAQRDTDTPDLGYHYDPLDYMFGGVDANANLTFTPGTAVGWFRTSEGWYHAGHGIHAADNTTITFSGTLEQPDYWVRGNTVQEQPSYAGYGPGGISGWTYPSVSDAPKVFARFTRCSIMAAEAGNHFRDDWGILQLHATDCTFLGGKMEGYDGLYYLTNCLFERTSLWLMTSETFPTMVLRNCTLRGGSLGFLHWEGGAEHFYTSVRDTIFDGTSIATGYPNDPSCVDYDFNAFLQGATRTSPQGANDRLVTSFNWQTSWLGTYYQPTNSPLINHGSRTADLAGLYHYTTLTNQVKETTSVVDIGYHYVAVDSNGKPIDTDGDGLPDYVEDANGNGSLDPGETDWTNADTDGDGLTDYEELTIPIDINHPELGHLDPLVADTGGTGTPDGQKDSDHDGLSNLGELRYYGSDPSNPHTFNAYKVDAEYFHTAKGGDSGALTYAVFSVTPVVEGGGLLDCSISGADAGASYDLYFVNNIAAQRWQWRRVLTGIQCDDAGEAMFQLQQPDPYYGFFVILSAEDQDGDGLTDGYEAWFTYSGRRTSVDAMRTDSDSMKDGWEVEYGLDPTDTTGINGDTANPDGDSYNNRAEHDAYYAATAPGYDATFDPLKAGPTQRPVVTIAPADPPVLGFTVRRDGGLGGSKASALTVYYAPGGTAKYGTDYTLVPAPVGLDRICAVDIPAGEDFVTVTIEPTPAGLGKGPLSVVVALTPYSVSPPTQVSDPLAWAYAVDWNHNRATNYFAGKAAGDGFMINLNKDSVSGYLTIKPTAGTAPLPYVNLASSGRGTVTRIEVPNQWHPSLSSKVAGEYYTSPTTPNGNGSPTYGTGNPSRTTVDRYGNVWVANRSVGDDGAGSITKIGVVIGGTRGKIVDGEFQADPETLPTGQSPGEYLHPPFIYNTCVDRDRDELIHTSYGLGNMLAWPDTALPSDSDDEAVIYYVRTTPTFARSIAVDGDNNVWVGSRENSWQELIDGVTGAPVTGQKFLFGSGGYGGVIDPYGVLWSPGYGYVGEAVAGVLRLVPGPIANALPGTAGGILPGTSDAYGIGIDPTTADVWAGGYSAGGVWHFQQSGCSRNIPFAPTGNASGNGLKGVVVDGTGNIWVAHAGTSTATPGQEVYRFRNTGEYLGRVDLRLSGVVAKAPHGVCIDSQGHIWAVCFQPAEDGRYYAMRIDPTDPTQGRDPDTGNFVGSVVEAVDLGEFPPLDNEYHGPYNYSDMTGFVSLGATQPAGVWDFVEDSAAKYTLWSSVTLDGDLNSGSIIVEVRAADRITDLPSWPFRRFTGSGSTETIPFGTPALKGRYLEVRVSLLRSFGATQSPVLRKLSLAWGAPGSDLQIDSHPKSQIVARGDPASFSVFATGTDLSYQWYKDGLEVGSSLSSLAVLDAQYGDAGKYHVRVTDARGTSLDSAEARLHINSTPDLTSTPTATVDNGSPALNEEVNFNASMDVSASPGQVYYQWRKNGVPITPGSGQCDTSDGLHYTATTYTISSVARADTAEYSVVFTDEKYWKVKSTAKAITVIDAPLITVDPTSLQITDPYATYMLTASVEGFTPVCQQWYKFDRTTLTRIPIPGATELVYTFPTPVTRDDLGYYVFEAFDENHIPHVSGMVQVYGDL